MEIGKPYLLDTGNESFKNLNGSNDDSLEYSRTNIWNGNFQNPEFSFGFELLHKDMEDIKVLIQDIKDCLKSLFAVSED